MRATAIAQTGGLLLCAALCLPGCQSSGGQRATVAATETVVVEVPRRQLVLVSEALTHVDPLPPAPEPAIPFGSACSDRGGCYSNRQLETLLGVALADRGRLADNLAAIRRLMSEALNTAKGNPDEADPAAVPGRGTADQDPR